MLGAVRRSARGLARGLARDQTNGAAEGPALILAPHPDDETIGCGALIARKTSAGTRVVVAVISDGQHFHPGMAMSTDRTAQIRRAEVTEAVSRLGVPASDLRLAGFVDGTLHRHKPAITRLIADLIEELHPAEIYTTGVFEPHVDHAAVGRAARAAARGTGFRGRLLEYPVWLWAQSPFGSGVDAGTIGAGLAALLPVRRFSQVRAEDHLAAKEHAIAAHASQLRRPNEVPVDAAWPVLPPDLLRQARHGRELFRPVAPTI